MSWTTATNLTFFGRGRAAPATERGDGRQLPLRLWCALIKLRFFVSESKEMAKSAQPAKMAQADEIELITQKYGNKTFEFINCLPFVSDANERAQLLYGIELEGRFAELPVFAGGTHDRTYVQLILGVSDRLATRVSVCEARVRQKTALQGDWSSCVLDKGGQKAIKVRLDVTSAKPTNFRVSSETLHTDLSQGWPALKELMDTHGNLRGADAKVVLAPQKVWKVQNNVGITWKLLQIDFEPRKSEVRDFFADEA